MFPWFHQIKREEAGEGEGGGGTAAAVVTETAEQKELREAREENARLKKSNEELQQSERAWSERALRGTRRVESDDEPAATDPASEEATETAEQFLDDVSKEGLAALKKRGFVTLADVQQLVKESIDRAVGDTRSEGQFQSLMSEEFPEMAADLKRVEKGLKPESEIFVLAAEIYRDAIALDPGLKGSKSALIMAARQAGAQLQLQGKRKVEDKQERQADRRARIDAQKPDHSERSEEDTSTTLTAKQKQMAKDLGISEEKFLKQQQRIKGERGGK